MYRGCVLLDHGLLLQNVPAGLLARLGDLLIDFAPAATHESLLAGLWKNEYEYGQEYFTIWKKTA